jgi:hypothetical protein
MGTSTCLLDSRDSPAELLYIAAMQVRPQLVVNALVALGTVIAAVMLATASVPAYSGNVQNWHGETLSQYR